MFIKRALSPRRDKVIRIYEKEKMNHFEYIKALDHHAYFIHAFTDSLRHLKDYLKNKFHISHAKNPDFFYEKYEIMTIDESRKIKEIHTSKSFIEKSKRIFIIEAKGITHEAQNSLLKIFEEPNEDSHFFLIMPSVDILLPTLRSRLFRIKSKQADEETETIKLAERFLKLSMKDKITFVDDLTKKISDEKAEKSTAQEFLHAIQSVLYKKINMAKITKDQQKSLQVISKALDYMNDRSPSIKQLLEFVALNM